MAKETKLKFKILNLSANDKVAEWAMTIQSSNGIDTVNNEYDVSITIDEAYFAEKVKEYEDRIVNVEAQPDMFEDYKTTIKSLKDNIKGVEADKKEAQLIEVQEFTGVVQRVDFTKSQIILLIPESIVPDIIKVRHQTEAFVVELK